MGIWNTKANAVFLQAVEMPSPEQRLAFLDEASGDNLDLRAVVNGGMGRNGATHISRTRDAE